MTQNRSERREFLRFGIALELFSIGWMVIEGSVGIIAGVLAHSVSLEAFGVDSGLELVSAAVVLRWLLLAYRSADSVRTANASEVAERVVGVGLLLLAAYVVAASAYQLLTQSRPDTSAPGLVLAVIAAVVMPTLYVFKRRNAERLDSQAMRGDAVETLTCGWMALTLLGGLGLHHLFGWWWADPAAALVLVPFLIREGWEGIHEWFH